MIRRWGAGDRDTVSELLRLLSSTAEVTTDDTATYVAVTGDQVVGMVTLCVFRTLTGPKAHLDHLVVAPDARRRGIGRALVEHAMTQAQAAGASRIDLTAHERKRAGHALYEALGFRRRDTTAFRLWL
jgi:ribosomal protein S18 acetylase RimI-like enzyme